ncbi:MAG: A/G-specific adenine glycosylase, partial [Verrucomicrobiota bacterium]
VNHCHAAAEGRPEQFPKLIPKKIERIEIQRAWVFDEQSHSILLYKIPESARRLAGHLELPELHKLVPESAPRKLLAKKSRGISNQRISEPIFETSLQGEAPKDHQWIRIAKLDSIQLPAPHRRWIRDLSGQI